jgi:hypothetical protein
MAMVNVKTHTFFNMSTFTFILLIASLHMNLKLKSIYRTNLKPKWGFEPIHINEECCIFLDSK